MNLKFDLTGQTFGRLTAKQYLGKSKWLCDCICGNLTKASSNALRSGSTKSCGCLFKELLSSRNKKDISGQKFGFLTAIKPLKTEKKQVWWECVCDCGNVCCYITNNIVWGNVISCGCRRVHKLKGSDSPSWNFNLTDEDRMKSRHIDLNYMWRKQVYERDNYTCQVTGQKGGDLVAHHLCSWHANKELRFDITNGVTVSKGIHKLFHKQYGYKNNTAEQFQDFQSKYNSQCEFIKNPV